MKVASLSGLDFARLALVMFLVMGAVSPLAAKRKDDVVVMKNGDHFTGEIKGLQQGELIFEADYMKDEVHLDWKKVERMESKDRFIVSFSNGQRLTGVISKKATTDASGNNFEVLAKGSVLHVRQSDVINIDQREASFWNQLTGSVDYGFSFTSDGANLSSALSADVAYSSSTNEVALATSSQFNSQSEGSSTNRFTFDSIYARTLTPKWSAFGLYGLLKSNQQDLDLRSTYGAGMTRWLFQSSRTSLRAFGGMVYTHEQYSPQTSTEPISNNAEALLGLKFVTFQFGKVNFNSGFMLFPGLSDAGRVRMSSQSNFKIDLPRNFYWSFQSYENYDSLPPVSAPKNDFGATSSVGWTF